jgi:PGF-pre-PGF domain-containing protein
MRNIEDIFPIGLVFVFLILLSSTASAKEITVDDNSNANLRSIQVAVNNSLTPGTNIAGSPYIWGNFSPKANRTKFSQVIEDSDKVKIDDLADKAIGNKFDSLPQIFVLGMLNPLFSASNENSKDLEIVKGPEDYPQAYFTVDPMSGPAPLTVQFTDLSQNATSRSWDFNNDGNPDSSEINPVYTYIAPGNYRAILRVSNANWTDTTDRQIIVQEVPSGQVLPVPNFNANPARGYAPLYVQFTDLSQNATSWSWDFGDGTNSTEKDPTHIYSTVGSYTVTLAVSNNNGMNSKSATIIVEEYKELPVANFTANVTRGYAPLSIQFTDSSQNATSWSWNFRDGNISGERNPVHTYSRAGIYTVILTVNNSNGTNSQNLRITVEEVPILPLANFNANPLSGNAPLTVQFTDTSQYAASRRWDFGDGTNSTEQNPIHIYSAAGTYNVNLKVNNANGTASKDATINVLKDSSGGGGSHSSGSRGSSGSSGGGGAGGSPEPQSNVAAKEISQAFVYSGKSVNFEFPRNVTSVVSLSFDSKKTAGKTTTIIEMLKGKSTLVSALPSGEVYKSLNIWVGNSGFATPSNIENAVISFKVDKSWMQDKKIDKSSITLNRYSDKKWNQLQTSLVSEDNNYLYFTAQTPGFSPFVIASNSITNATTVNPVAAGTKIQPGNETNIQPGFSAQNIKFNDTKPEGEQKNEEGKNANLPVFGMICMITLLLIAFIFKIDKP